MNISYALVALATALTPASTDEFDAMDHRMPIASKEAIVASVNQDPEWPITGSKRGDALLVGIYMQHESFFKRNAVGDHGLALGSLQIQGVDRRIAFDYGKSVSEWLRRAHISVEHCSGKVDTSEELAELASGSCRRGHLVARTRYREAMGRLTAFELVSSSSSEISLGETGVLMGE